MKTFLIALFIPFSIFGQNTIGLPDIINYSKQSFTAGLQNWDIKQDANGVMYFANNEGLLSYDGNDWKLYSLPNKTIVRSVEIGFDGRIYVGGQDELGYFSPGENGLLTYHSLTNLIPSKDKTFGDVWDIVSINKNIFFRSDNKIFKLTNQAFATFNAPSEWHYMGVSNGVLYAHDYKTGIMYFENDAIKTFNFKNILPENDPVTSITPINKESSLITTLKNGLYILTQQGLIKKITKNDNVFKTQRIYAATFVNTEWVALATNNNGVLIIDLQGNIIQSFTTNDGLQNNNVLSIFLDKQQNLWLGLDNGIDLVAYNSAIKQIKPTVQIGSGYTALIFGNKLYLGTTNGLYSTQLQPVKDYSYSKSNFTAVSNAQGQTWGLAEINNRLLMGHHEGAFEVVDNTAVQVSNSRGFWNFLPLSTTFPSQTIVAGNYKGLTFFEYANGQFTQSGELPGFLESSRFIAIDQMENIWVSHPYHGVFKISGTNTKGYTIATYKQNKGLPSDLNNHIYKIKNEVLVATEKGIYTYDYKTDTFKPSAYYGKLLGQQSIRYLKEDPDGNIWFIKDKMPGIADLSGKEAVVINMPELNNKLLSGFEFIYPVNKNNIFIGGEKGFFHINYEKYKQSLITLDVQIRSVKAQHTKDSLLFGGYYNNVNEKQVQDNDKKPEIVNGLKTLRFEFSSSLFAYQSNLEYSYRLKGFDENWSAYTKRTEKEYTNLPPGNFLFEVKVRNNLGAGSPVASFGFTVLPPWYKTKLALTIFGLLFIVGNYIFFSWLKIKFKKQQERHVKEQQNLLYIHELEMNKTASELVTLKNEKLEADINFKNSELATSAMHLLKKGELLAKVKTELTSAMKNIENPKTIADLKKMIKSLNEDDNMDKEWEHFAIHFDKVHSDFLVDLKEKHPAITGNELKLCAYLRMNLSTKEIAQLMNISIRGVEISRYRLRKKLQIDPEINLFDYMINFKTVN